VKRGSPSVEKFFIKDKKYGQLSDHYGAMVSLEIVEEKWEKKRIMEILCLFFRSSFLLKNKEMSLQNRWISFLQEYYLKFLKIFLRSS